MAGQHPLAVYLFVYLTLSVATVNAVIIEEQWVAVKDFFARIKNFVSEGPATTTTPTPRFIPRGTMQTIQRQPSRLSQNLKNKNSGCEITFRTHATQSLLADDERVYEPQTYESGICRHDCYQDKYTGKWVCCQPTVKENVELFYFRPGSDDLHMRSVEKSVVSACGYF